MPELKPSPYASLDEVPRLTLADLAATIPEGQHLMRKATAASVIAPRYGKDFFVELFRANEYNKKLQYESRPGLKRDTYSRMFDYVPTMVGGPGLKGASYRHESLPHEEKLLETYPWLKGLPRIKTYGKEAAAAKGPQRSRTKEARALWWGEKAMAKNSYTADRPLPSPQDTLEHELTHNLRPLMGRRVDMWGYRYEKMPKDVKEIGEMAMTFAPKQGKDRTPLKIKDIHESYPAEFMGSLGRLQRETFQATRRRVGVDPKTGEPRAGEFKELVLSGKTPEYLSQEGQRILTYSRNVLKIIEKSGKGFAGETDTWKKTKKAKAERLKKTFFDRIDQLLPALVESDQLPSKRLS